jgi:MerR family transcriptional regulator, thiopeptide resistance regulator
VKPLRTAAFRRCNSPPPYTRRPPAVALKRAGFSLKKIGELLTGRTVDLGRLIAAQIAEVDAQAAALADSRTLLLTVQSRIDRGEPIDVATLCSLIRHGDSIMQQESWKAVVDDYFTPDEQERFNAKMADVPDGYSQAAYGEKWRALGQRIEAAMPLAPMSDTAQAFVDEWFALLKPFSDVATPEMWNGTVKMYGDMDNWKASPDVGFSKAVWDFIMTATRARLEAGGTVDGPAWMTNAK